MVEADLEELESSGQLDTAGIIAHLVMSVVLALIISLDNATDVLSVILIGILAWIGFIVPILTGELIREKTPF